MTIDKALPTEFELYVGSYDGPRLEVKLAGEKLIGSQSEDLYRPMHVIKVQPDLERWVRFWEEVDRCGVWDWPQSTSISVLDGTIWQIHVAMAGRVIDATGWLMEANSVELEDRRDFPRFLAAVDELLGESAPPLPWLSESE